MITALEEARTGAREGGVPIGAVLVNARGTVVATGRNRRLQEGAFVMHAEIYCLLNAGQKLSSFRGMTMYSTLIPCNMCAVAIVHSGIIKVVYGESRNLPEDNGRELLVRYGVELADLDLEEARRMLRAFIETEPEEWSADIGRWARREDRTIGRSRVANGKEGTAVFLSTPARLTTKPSGNLHQNARLLGRTPYEGTYFT